jgi:hypothetical protein
MGLTDSTATASASTAGTAAASASTAGTAGTAAASASLVSPIAGDAAAEAFLSPARWSATPHDRLEAAGYRIDELVLRGQSRIFTDGRVRPPDASGASAHYATRVLAIRPVSDTDFSGVVHVELINPSTGADFPMFWPDAAAHLIRMGHAYLGVTCKRVTVDALRRISPQRYGELEFGHDGAIWDLIGAVGAACRREQAGGLLPGLRAPERTLINGWSQSGSFLRTYLSEGLHELHRGEHGHDPYDGYLIGVSSGAFGPMGYVNVDRDGEGEFDDELRPLTPFVIVPLDDPRRVVRGSRVPVIEFMSEEEAVTHLWHQRPDSDVPGDLYRCYQIPARGHESGLLDDRVRVADHEALGEPLPGEEGLPVHHRASEYLLAATLENLLAWTRGVPAPRADPIPLRVDLGFERDPLGVDFSGVSAVRDADDHALGGVRYLEVELPVAHMAAKSWHAPAMNPWEHRPFDAEELRRRYGSPDALRERAERVVAALVAERWYLPDDAAAAVEAFMAGLPRSWDPDPRLPVDR